MNVIWKFVLSIPEAFDIVKVDMPKDAEILTAQLQGDKVSVWAMVDPEAPKETRLLRIVGTGWDSISIPDNYRYIGTFQLYEGAMVFHVLEVLE